jgi:NAD(P)-dependent dehydrogenase (short-subunit alcohol dehydrogenase family)
MSSLFDLTGKTAIVTGASGGIGQAIAVALAQAGARIAGVARSSQAETAQAVKTAGGDYLAIKADLASIAPVERILEETTAWAGRADILVNNAGIIRRADPLEFGEKDWDDVINVDLKSVFFLAQAFARRAVARGGGGKIINVASILASVGGIRVPSYTAAKHGVLVVQEHVAPHRRIGRRDAGEVAEAAGGKLEHLGARHQRDGNPRGRGEFPVLHRRERVRRALHRRALRPAGDEDHDYGG